MISKRLVDIAKKYNADAIAHGATGKGNDQVRFELSAYAIDPEIKVIAPWREWNLDSREKLLQYAKDNSIEVELDSKNDSPYSMDANLLHISYEGKSLEDPWSQPPKEMWKWVIDPKDAPDKQEELLIGFKNGDPVSINGKELTPANLFIELNEIGAKNGIGRIDIVENRFVGMKSRGCYETPGGTILLSARRALESICLDREVAHLKSELMPKYASMIYNGFWWSPERLALQELIDFSQKNVNGEVKLSLYKGNIEILGRKSDSSLYRPDISTFEEDLGAYNQKDAEGFINLNALRLKIKDKN